MKTRPGAQGQAMLEFALVFPLIILVMLMFIEIGRVVYYYSALNNAVREGARLGIINGGGNEEAAIQSRVTGYAIWLPLSAGDVTVHCDGDATDVGARCDDSVTVSAQMQVAPMTPLLTRILGMGNAYHLNAESTMRMSPWGSFEP